MNRLFQIVLFFLAFCVVALAPAIVDYYIENSRWQSVQQLPESIDALQESYSNFIDAVRPLSNPEELAKAKKDHELFQAFRLTVRERLGELDQENERLRSLFMSDSFLYFINYYTRTNVGLYLHLGFFISTIIGFALLIRLKRQINKKISDERATMEAAKKKELRAAEEREWKLKQRVANLEGEVQRMTADSVTPVLTPKCPENEQKGSPQQYEPRFLEPVASEIEKPREWKLFLVFNDSEKGNPMPQRQRQFMRALSPYLKNELASIDSKILHRKLRQVGNLSPVERSAKMDKIRKGSIFEGWYKMHLGSSFRILTKFDDEKREMRFFLATHDIYRKIHRK